MHDARNCAVEGPTGEQLWDFYERSGFLYESKREAIEPHSEAIRETLDCLLHSRCDINRLFLIRNGDRIDNALNVTKYYPNTWLIHHMVSHRNPAGMLAILVDGMRWIMENPSIDFGTFYWRPDNRRSERIFRHMSNLLSAERPGAHEVTLYDYYFLDLDDFAARLSTAPHFRVDRADRTEHEEISVLLAQHLTDVQVRYQGLDPDHLSLAPLDREFRRFGLRRTREVFVARRGGEIAGVGLAEDSSMGLNLSYYFNKFHIHLVNEALQADGRRDVFHQLGREICRYYLESGNRFAATLCEPERVPYYQELGLQPQKQYCNMTISRPMERGVCVDAVQGYYQKRLRRLRGTSIPGEPTTH